MNKNAPAAAAIAVGVWAANGLGEADAVVLVTEWDQFKELDWATVAEVMRGNILIDGRNSLDPAAVREAGLVYEGIGTR